MKLLRTESRRLLAWCVSQGEFTQGDIQRALNISQVSASHIVIRLVDIGALDIRREKRGAIPSIYIATEQAEAFLSVQPKPANGYVRKKDRPESQWRGVNSVFQMGAI